MDLKLKTLVITFNDDSTSADVAEVKSHILAYTGNAVFIIEDGETTEVVPDAEVCDGRE